MLAAMRRWVSSRRRWLVVKWRNIRTLLLRLRSSAVAWQVCGVLLATLGLGLLAGSLLGAAAGAGLALLCLGVYAVFGAGVWASRGDW